MEALACQEIFVRSEEDKVRLVWSFMHEDETILCPFPERKYEVLCLATLCKVRVGPEEAISKLAKSFEKNGRLSAKDAIHLACASYVGADFFLTCDDRLIKQAKRLKLNIAVMNPVDYVRQVVNS
jgi:predicted nucleic acid-binding protein